MVYGPSSSSTVHGIFLFVYQVRPIIFFSPLSSSSSSSSSSAVFIHSFIPGSLSFVYRITNPEWINLQINPEDKVPLKSQTLREPIFLKPEVTLLEALGTFRKARCHIAVICDDPFRAVRCMRSEEFISYEPKMMGIVTMEDCIEQILQDDIVDETDVFTNNNNNNNNDTGGSLRNSGVRTLNQTLKFGKLNNSRKSSTGKSRSGVYCAVETQDVDDHDEVEGF
jgi:hypothetical protein